VMRRKKADDVEGKRMSLTKVTLAGEKRGRRRKPEALTNAIGGRKGRGKFI